MTKKANFDQNYNLSNVAVKKRYQQTLAFVNATIAPPSKILDLGVSNPFTPLLKASGYEVTNTDENQDLDLDYHQVTSEEYDVVTAFQIFEHMLAPFNLLREIKAPNLIVSVPLNLWFSKSYWNKDDQWDRHYHEFEPRQLDMLLERSGWNIVKSEKWVEKSTRIGLRTIFRKFTPRFYTVHCQR